MAGGLIYAVGADLSERYRTGQTTVSAPRLATRGRGVRRGGDREPGRPGAAGFGAVGNGRQRSGDPDQARSRGVNFEALVNLYYCEENTDMEKFRQNGWEFCRL